MTPLDDHYTARWWLPAEECWVTLWADVHDGRAWLVTDTGKYLDTTIDLLRQWAQDGTMLPCEIGTC